MPLMAVMFPHCVVPNRGTLDQADVRCAPNSGRKAGMVGVPSRAIRSDRWPIGAYPEKLRALGSLARRLHAAVFVDCSLSSTASFLQVDI